MSGYRTSPRYDVVATTRRSWSREQKRAIVAEVDVGGAKLSEVARRHGIHASLLFRWRKTLGAVMGAPSIDAEAATSTAVVRDRHGAIASAGPDEPPALARNQCRTGRLWTHVRDDRPFGGSAPAAAVYYYSPTREGEHAERQLARYTGIVQADAYSGFNGLFVPGRQPGPIVEAACWAHSRRKFFELARLRKMPIAIEAVQRIDALFAIERDINGVSPAERKATRQARSKLLVESFETWLRAERKKLSPKGPLAKAIDYQLNHWAAFTRFLDDGRICLSNNAAERAIRGIAMVESFCTPFVSAWKH
jgi:transposase-like protein